MTKYKTRQQIARELGVSRRTFYRMLKRKGINLTPGLITPKEQEKIYKKLQNTILERSPDK
jgi:DNA invertase Pin-like site-specific DNA recombinase